MTISDLTLNHYSLMRADNLTDEQKDQIDAMYWVLRKNYDSAVAMSQNPSFRILGEHLLDNFDLH